MRGIDLLLQAARDMNTAPAPSTEEERAALDGKHGVAGPVVPAPKRPSTPKLVLPPPQEMHLPFAVLPETPSTDSTPSLAMIPKSKGDGPEVEKSPLIIGTKTLSSQRALGRSLNSAPKAAVSLPKEVNPQFCVLSIAKL